MFLTAHSSIALVIATLPLPFWVLGILSFVSHYIIDIIPHGDEKILHRLNRNQKIRRMITIAMIEVILVLSLWYWYSGQSTTYTARLSWLLIILACLPDGIQFINYLTKSKFKLLHAESKFHRFMHTLTKQTVSFKIGLMIQLSATALCVLILNRL